MRYKPTRYQHVFLTGSGRFLPGKPVSNTELDNFIAPINKQSHRIKRRILAENGIVQRHYAIDEQGSRVQTVAGMAASAVQISLSQSGKSLEDVSLLVTGTSGGDVLMPGLANMLQGELQAPPMETHSHHGICAAGVHALKDAANLVESGDHTHALVAAVESPSRLFKHTRFESMGYDLDFDAHFLRWMLSDGAGACVLSSNSVSQNSFVLKVDWIHSKSFSGDFPVCMQLGQGNQGSGRYFMDFDSFALAESNGVLALRQNIRLLPQLFEVGVHEYTELVHAGFVDPEKVDYFLCHYSSEKLGGVTDQLMQKAGLGISKEKWFSNLSTCGNTGSASIYIMLADFLRQTELKPGQKIFCFVPESGRFTVTYMQFTVVSLHQNEKVACDVDPQTEIPPPHDPQSGKNQFVRDILQQLAGIWHGYRSTIWRSLLVKKIIDQSLTLFEYQQWMAYWIPQVREGSVWMRKAIDRLPNHLHELAELILIHAGEEQDDYQILYDDYCAAGGTMDIDHLNRNAGGEALNAYMHSLAGSDRSMGLLGGIYIIEGTGQRIIPVLLPYLRRQLPLNDRGFRFLRYHGENDMHHLNRWLSALQIAVLGENGRENAGAIIQSAKDVAVLYQLQWEHVLQ